MVMKNNLYLTLDSVLEAALNRIYKSQEEVKFSPFSVVHNVEDNKGFMNGLVSIAEGNEGIVCGGVNYVEHNAGRMFSFLVNVAKYSENNSKQYSLFNFADEIDGKVKQRGLVNIIEEQSYSENRIPEQIGFIAISGTETIQIAPFCYQINDNPNRHSEKKKRQFGVVCVSAGYNEAGKKRIEKISILGIPVYKAKPKE